MRRRARGRIGLSMGGGEQRPLISASLVQTLRRVPGVAGVVAAIPPSRRAAKLNILRAIVSE
jgi:hypothetical protein